MSAETERVDAQAVGVKIVDNYRNPKAPFIVYTKGSTARSQPVALSEGLGIAIADTKGDCHLPFLDASSVSIVPAADSYTGRFALTDQGNMVHFLLIDPAQWLVNILLATATHKEERGASLADTITLDLSQFLIARTLSEPEAVAARDALRIALENATSAPADLIAAARSAADGPNVVPLLHRFLGPLR